MKIEGKKNFIKKIWSMITLFIFPLYLLPLNSSSKIIGIIIIFCFIVLLFNQLLTLINSDFNKYFTLNFSLIISFFFFYLNYIWSLFSSELSYGLTLLFFPIAIILPVISQIIIWIYYIFVKYYKLKEKNFQSSVFVINTILLGIILINLVHIL